MKRAAQFFPFKRSVDFLSEVLLLQHNVLLTGVLLYNFLLALHWENLFLNRTVLVGRALRLLVLSLPVEVLELFLQVLLVQINAENVARLFVCSTLSVSLQILRLGKQPESFARSQFDFPSENPFLLLRELVQGTQGPASCFAGCLPSARLAWTLRPAQLWCPRCGWISVWSSFE